MSTPISPVTRGLVIANLGTPRAPTAEAVRTYLREFLTDKRVVQIPHLVWKPLLDWVILPRRSPVVAEKYAEIEKHTKALIAMAENGLTQVKAIEEQAKDIWVQEVQKERQRRGYVNSSK